MIAATPLALVLPPDTFDGVSAAPVLEEPVSAPAEPPPITLTGDDETDEALALMRTTTTAIHDAQDRVADLSQERKRLVLYLRRRSVPFRQIAAAADSTEQTIYKIHREAKADEEAEQEVVAEAEAVTDDAADRQVPHPDDSGHDPTT